MTIYTAQLAGEERALQVINLGDASSQTIVSPSSEVKPRLTMNWQVTSKGLRATWQKTFLEK